MRDPSRRLLFAYVRPEDRIFLVTHEREELCRKLGELVAILSKPQPGYVHGEIKEEMDHVLTRLLLVDEGTAIRILSYDLYVNMNAVKRISMENY